MKEFDGMCIYSPTKRRKPESTADISRFIQSASRRGALKNCENLKGKNNQL